MQHARPTSYLGNLIAFENGELSAEETIDLFSILVTTGDAWSLQGSYGRTAMRLIQAGYLNHQGTVLSYPEDN